MKRVLILLCASTMLACTSPQGTEVTEAPLYTTGDEALTFKVSNNRDLVSREIIQNSGFQRLAWEVQNFAPTPGLTYQEREAQLTDLWTKIDAELAQAAAQQMISLHLLTDMLLLPEAPYGYSQEAIAKHVNVLAQTHPTETKVIYTGLTHLRGYWKKGQIDAAVQMTVEASETYLAELERDLQEGRKKVTTEGFEQMQPQVRNIQADAQTETQEYLRYLREMTE